MIKIVVSLVTILSVIGIGSAANASCGDLLNKLSDVVRVVSGKDPMQEATPVGQQQIAKSAPGDEEIAFRWVAREIGIDGIIREIVREEWNFASKTSADPYKEIAEFVVTIPGWKRLLNEKIRALVQIDRVLRSIENVDGVRKMVPHHTLSLRDREDWTRLFPGRSIPNGIEHLHIF